MRALLILQVVAACASLAGGAPIANFDSAQNRPVVLKGVPFKLHVALQYPGEDLVHFPNVTSLLVQVHTTQEIISSTHHPLVDSDTGNLLMSLQIPALTLQTLGRHPLNVTVGYSPAPHAATYVGAPATAEYSPVVIRGALSLAPVGVVLAVALLSREVLWALFAGVFTAAALVAQGNLVEAFLRSLDVYVLGSLVSREHGYILLFSWFLGGMVQVLQKCGGSGGIASAITSFISTRTSFLLVAYALGFVIFFDDYANTLILGATMRPLADLFHVSKEKLAFIVDATAAPVASIAPISSWIGVELGFIQDQLEDLERQGYGRSLEEAGLTSAYGIFLASLGSRYYPVLMLVLQGVLLGTGREMGPMLLAERRALDRHQGWASSDGEEGPAACGAGSAGGSGAASGAASPDPDLGLPQRWWNGVLPIAATLAVVFAGMVGTGAEQSRARGLPASVANVFGNGDAYGSLMWGTFVGSLVAFALSALQYRHRGALFNPWRYWLRLQPVPRQLPGEADEGPVAGGPPRPLLTFRESLEVWVEGVKGLVPCMLVLVMAWAIGAAVKAVSCDLYFASLLLGSSLDPRTLPALTFLISSVIAFCTGTSFGTMSIMFPLVVPAAWIASTPAAAASGGAGSDAANNFILVISAILSGSVFGDHASIISDTTILSAAATKCNLQAHIVTQLPYALVVGFISVLAGYFPAAYFCPPWLAIAAGSAAVYAFVMLLCTPLDDPQRKMDPTMRLLDWVCVTCFSMKPREVYIPLGYHPRPKP